MLMMCIFAPSILPGKAAAIYPHVIVSNESIYSPSKEWCHAGEAVASAFDMIKSREVRSSQSTAHREQRVCLSCDPSRVRVWVRRRRRRHQIHARLLPDSKLSKPAERQAVIRLRRELWDVARDAEPACSS